MPRRDNEAGPDRRDLFLGEPHGRQAGWVWTLAEVGHGLAVDREEVAAVFVQGVTITFHFDKLPTDPSADRTSAVFPASDGSKPLGLARANKGLRTYCDPSASRAGYGTS